MVDKWTKDRFQYLQEKLIVSKTVHCDVMGNRGQKATMSSDANVGSLFGKYYFYHIEIWYELFVFLKDSIL